MLLRFYPTRAKKGFSIIELSIVMMLTVIISAVLVMFWSQSRYTLERGMEQTALQQKVRMASIRIVPRISSAFRIAPDATSPDPVLRDDGLLPIEWPHPDTAGMVFPAPPAPQPSFVDRPNYQAALAINPVYRPSLDIGEPRLRMNSTREFVKDQLRLPIIPIEDVYNPRDPRFAQLELEFIVTDAVHPEHPELGQLGNLVMRGYLDNNDNGDFRDDPPTDDIVIASGLTDVSFLLYNGEQKRVRVRIEARGLRKTAMGKVDGADEPYDRAIYETDIFLPVYTNSI